MVSHSFPEPFFLNSFLNSSSDVIGIVKEVSALSEITSSKLNRQVKYLLYSIVILLKFDALDLQT